jgi:hypothetical protein
VEREIKRHFQRVGNGGGVNAGPVLVDSGVVWLLLTLYCRCLRLSLPLPVLASADG